MKFDPRTEARKDDGDLIIEVDGWEKAGYIATRLYTVYAKHDLDFRRTDKSALTGKVEVSCTGGMMDSLYYEIVGYAKAVGDMWDRFTS